MTQRISITIAFLTGLGMIFIGTRFMLAPEIAEASYGIHFNAHGDFSFHYIKGIRDIFTGLLICTLILSRQIKALGIAMVLGTIIPTIDMLIVLTKDYNGIVQAIPHISAIIVCAITGTLLLLHKSSEKALGNQGYSKLISATDKNKETIVEYCIIPNEKTPWHYHTLFSETFEILNGTLEVGLNNRINLFKIGDKVTIKPNEKHYFHNISKNDCLIKVTINPGNTNFENSLLILKGLANEGLASTAGTPKKLSDLALFVYLNNSRMVGFQKIAEPFFKLLARKAIKRGRLQELELKYCQQRPF